MCFMDLEKAYDRANRDALLQLLRTNDVGGELLNGIKSILKSIAYIRVKGVRVSVSGSIVV